MSSTSGGKYEIGDRVKSVSPSGVREGKVTAIRHQYQVEWDPPLVWWSQWWADEQTLIPTGPKPKFEIGDRVVIHLGDPNEQHGTVEKNDELYYVCWDNEWEHPVGPYPPRRLLHLEEIAHQGLSDSRLVKLDQ